MVSKRFFEAGHPPTLFSAFFYFDMSFMVWVMLGPLGVQIAGTLGLDAGQRGLMVAVPLLAGALLRVVNGVLVDRIGPLRTGMIGQVIVLAGLLAAWWFGVHSFHQVLALGVVLGVAGASFAVALPLASRWYPPELQGVALGIAGAGNSGVVFAALFAPGLAAAYGWTNVLGLAAIPVAIAFACYLAFARESPNRPPAKTFAQYLEVFRIGDAWWFMLFYSVTFGGFSGLASSLPSYFHDQYGLDPKVAGYFAAACVFAGSLVRPIGGTLADRIGGIRTLTVMYATAAVALGVVSFGLPTAAMALIAFVVGMLAFGMGNGAVFQLVPQRFYREIGIMTGLVGMTGGIGGFYLASSLGYSKQFSGSYQTGFLVFAALAVIALLGITSVKKRWRTTWGAVRRRWPDLMLPSHCPYCALQCGMTLATAADGRLETAARDFPTNKGGLCRKGWTAAEPLQSADRLTTPLLRDRKDGPLRPATWDEAMTRVAAGIATAQARTPDGVGIFGGGGLTNEKAYMLGKFARIGLGTRYIDYNGRFCMASGAAAGIRAFGMDRGLPFPLDDLPGADTILIVGSNPAETMPPIMQYFEAQQAKGGRLIVADPRRTATAQAATMHLQPVPGTDAALANGLLHVAVRDKLIDEAFIAGRTEGFEPVRRLVQSWWPDRAERVTGVPARQIEAAAHQLGEAEHAIILTGRGPEQQSHGVDNVLAFINLALALGKAGKRHSGWGTLTGQGNGQGGREHGQKADQLPGYRMLANPAHRAHVAAVWGVDPASLPQPGLPAMEMLALCGAPGGIGALLVLGSNLLISAPDAGQLRTRLQALDMLVVLDPFLSETAAIADVVLPTTQWAEEEGTMTNLEGRILLRRRMTEPLAGVRTDTVILKDLADRLGVGARFDASPRANFEELRLASAGGTADYAGVTWDRIAAEDGVFWPCPNEGHPGTPRPFLDRFATESGRARFHRVDHHATAEAPDQDYPLVLTTGRVMAQYQSGTQTRRVAALNEAEPEAFCEINADMARTLGVAQGDMVRVTSRRGTATARARLTRTIRLDTVFMPFHWGGTGCANLLTSTYRDPVSGIPEYKVCAVQVMRADAAATIQPVGTVAA